MFGGNFAPAGWLLCQGQLLPISENETLFQLIGTTYGGDGQSTFALPDLRGRIPVHAGSGFILGQSGGSESVTLTVAQIPSHSHVPLANSGQGNQSDPTGHIWAASPTSLVYAAGAAAAMNPAGIPATGGSQPHENMMPFLAINFIISLFGIFPSQT
jgi:microcystin-dependent protein